MITLVNSRTSQTIASSVEVADTRATRRRGLLGRDGIDLASALVITPCWAVHTAFMRFPIDVVFVNRDGRVLRVAPRLAPWRIAAAPGAHAVIELAAGAAELRGVQIFDQLYVCSDDGGRWASAFGAMSPLRAG